MIKIKHLQVKPTVVYDITVPETQSFIANHIVVHNCLEILLPTKPLESIDGVIKNAKIRVPKDKVEEYKKWRARQGTFITKHV